MADKIELTQEDFQEMNTAMKGLLKKQDELGAQAAEVKSYAEKVETMATSLKKLDDWNNQQVTKIKEKEAKEIELMDRIKHLETLAGSMASKQSNDPKEIKQIANLLLTGMLKKGKATTDGGLALNEVVEQYPQAWKNYCNYIAKKDFSGFTALPPEIKSFKSNIEREIKANPSIMRTDIGEFGGFTVPVEWSTELLYQIIEQSPMRKYCRVKQIGGKTLMQPIRQGVPIAQDEGETQQTTASQSNYTMAEITPYRISNLTAVTWDMMNDSQYNIAEEIMKDNAIAFAALEGKNCVTGNGVRRALGFTQDKDVPLFTTATSTITFDDLIKMSGELKTGYKPMFFFNRRTAAYLRSLKDADNRYLWNEFFGSAVAGLPLEINGYSYSNEFIDMDDTTVATGNPILFADMARFYQITDRTDMIMIRDEFTQATQAIVNFNLMRWTTGQAIMKEAGILMKVHA